MSGERDGRDRDDEADLRQAFAALRAEEAADAPGFPALARAADAPAPRPRVPDRRQELVTLGGGILAAASLAAAVFLTVGGTGPSPTPPPVLSVESWRAPTDFLLRTPGLEILETVPRIGRLPALEPHPRRVMP